MSSSTNCDSCGAPADVSEATCGFCKRSLMGPSEGNLLAPAQYAYERGQLDRALLLVSETLKTHPSMATEPSLVLLHVKLLIETEGACSRAIRLLVQAHLAHPDDQQIKEYLDLAEAKHALEREKPQAAEALRRLLERSPRNAHASFLLGTYLFWCEHADVEAIGYLERCVRVRPAFVRAWACLGALYKNSGRFDLAFHAFQKCVELEANSDSKEVFREQLKNCS